MRRSAFACIIATLVLSACFEKDKKPPVGPDPDPAKRDTQWVSDFSPLAGTKFIYRFHRVDLIPVTICTLTLESKVLRQSATDTVYDVQESRRCILSSPGGVQTWRRDTSYEIAEKGGINSISIAAREDTLDRAVLFKYNALPDTGLRSANFFRSAYHGDSLFVRHDQLAYGGQPPLTRETGLYFQNLGLVYYSFNKKNGYGPTATGLNWGLQLLEKDGVPVNGDSLYQALQE